MNNENTTLNPKDKTFEEYKKNAPTTAQKQAVNVFKDKDFEQEYKPIQLSATALKYVCSIASALTMVTAVYFVLSILINKILALIIGLIFCALFEIIKAYTWNVTAQGLLKYKRSSKVAILALVSIHTVSLSSSIYGAYKIPTFLTVPINEQAKSKLDSIKRTYIEQAVIIDKQITALKDRTNSSTVRRTIQALTTQKGKILEAQNSAIESEKEKEQALIKENKEESAILARNRKEQIKELQISCVSLAFLFELAFVLCSLFISYYLFRCFIDIQDISAPANEEQGKTAKIENSQTGARAPNVSAQKIGFLQGLENKEINDNRKKENGNSNSEKLKYTKVCKLNSCDTKFIHKIHNQKYCSEKCKVKAHIERKKKSISN